MIINREIECVDVDVWFNIDRAIDKGGWDAWGVILDTQACILTARDMRTGVLFNVHVFYDPEYLRWVVGGMCDDGSRQILDKAIEEYCARNRKERIDLETLLSDIDIDLSE
jgi:hypothetical protein